MAVELTLPDTPVLAGMVSTTLFVVSYLPMLVKAYRTKDLGSYSLGNLAIANVGNAVHSVYVFSLPLGPIWYLHTFYLVSTAVMLFWFWRYARPRAPGPREPEPPSLLAVLAPTPTLLAWDDEDERALLEQLHLPAAA